MRKLFGFLSVSLVAMAVTDSAYADLASKGYVDQYKFDLLQGIENANKVVLTNPLGQVQAGNVSGKNGVKASVSAVDGLVVEGIAATKDQIGVVTVGDNINVTNGKISVPAATASGYGVVKVDTALSTSSTNPVQNKAVANSLNGKEDTANKKSSGYTSGSTTQYPSIAGAEAIAAAAASGKVDSHWDGNGNKFLVTDSNGNVTTSNQVKNTTLQFMKKYNVTGSDVATITLDSEDGLVEAVTVKVKGSLSTPGLAADNVTAGMLSFSNDSGDTVDGVAKYGEIALGDVDAASDSKLVTEKAVVVAFDMLNTSAVTRLPDQGAGDENHPVFVDSYGLVNAIEKPSAERIPQKSGGKITSYVDIWVE